MEEPPTLTPEEQYAAIRENVGFLRLGHRTQIELTGPDRAAVLNNLCTNDVMDLRPTTGCEAFVTSARGKVLGHVLIFAEEDALVVETVAGQADRLLPHFEKYIIREDVELQDRSAQWAEILLAGPRAAELWRTIGAGTAPDLICRHVTVEMADGPVAVRRVPMTSGPTWLISADADVITSLADRLRHSGAADCQAEACEQVRIESGWPVYGSDITDRNLPQEIDRDSQAISFDKGCYLGQEPVARIDALGHVNRKLTGLRFSTADIPAVGTECFHGAKIAGRVTSAAYSPRLSAALAMGYVRREHVAVGSRLESATGPVEVVALPVT
jgi:folate-binding protein YgfZ